MGVVIRVRAQAKGAHCRASKESNAPAVTCFLDVSSR